MIIDNNEGQLPYPCQAEIQQLLLYTKFYLSQTRNKNMFKHFYWMLFEKLKAYCFQHQKVSGKFGMVNHLFIFYCI